MLLLFTKGKEFYRLGEYEKALKCFEEAIKSDSNNTDYLFAIGSTNYYLYDVEKALDYYEKCLKLDSNNIKSILGKISCLEDLGKEKEALILIDSFLIKNYNDLVAARKGITLMFLNCDKEEVFSCFENLKIKNDPLIYYLKSMACHNFLDWENQIKYLNKASKYSDKKKTRLDKGVYVNRRDINLTKLEYYFNFEDYNNALNICNMLLYENREDLEALYQKARIYYQKSDFENSLNVLKSALYLYPNNISLLNLKATIYSIQGTQKAALLIYEKINNIDPYLEYSWGNMAFIYYFNKEYEKSYQHAKKALDINPNYGFAIYYGSRALKKLGKKKLYLDWERKLSDHNVDRLYLEKNLQDRLVDESWRFESIGHNLKFKEREYTLKDRPGRLDILYEDIKTGNLIVVELKIIKANSDAYYQIADYVDSIKNTIGKKREVKGLLVSLGQNDDCKKLIDKDPEINQVDYKKLGLE